MQLKLIPNKYILCTLKLIPEPFLKKDLPHASLKNAETQSFLFSAEKRGMQKDSFPLGNSGQLLSFFVFLSVLCG
jgi:hypothetical protein